MFLLRRLLLLPAADKAASDAKAAPAAEAKPAEKAEAAPVKVDGKAVLKPTVKHVMAV